MITKLTLRLKKTVIDQAKKYANIIYDLLGEREPFYLPAAKLFTLTDEGKIRIFISALSLANLQYLVSKQKSAQIANEILGNFKVLVHVAPLNEKIIDLALNSDFPDFKDAIHYFSALQNEIEVLLTRNLKDYKKAQITVLTAQDYINL